MSNLFEEDFRVVPLFSNPVMEKNISEITREEKKLIFNYEYERMPSENGFFTKNKYILNLPEMNRIKSEIIKSFNLYIRNVLHIIPEVDFKLTTSWIVKHVPGDFSNYHFHSNSVFSGVLYIEAPKECGNLTFKRTPDCSSFFPKIFTVECKEWNVYNAQTYSFVPTNNKIIFFPSSTFHAIERNKSNENRYSLAFNFFPKGKIGAGAAELYLN